MDKFVRRIPPKPNVINMVADETSQSPTLTTPTTHSVTPASSDFNPSSKPGLNPKPSSSKTVSTNKKEKAQTRTAEQEHPAASSSSTANIEIVQLDNEPRSDKESSNSEPPSKKRKQIYKFNDDWLSASLFCKWLEKKEEKDKEPTAFCKLCEVTIINHKPVLERHASSTRHKTNAIAIQHSSPISELIQKQNDGSQDRARRAEVKCTAFLAEHNLPLSLADSLVPFLRNTLPDSKIAQEMCLGRTKATHVLTKVVAPTCRSELIQHLKTTGNFFSLVMDETTDVSTKKQCALSVIFFNTNTKTVETRFLDLYETESGKAEDLCTDMLTRLKNDAIPFDNAVGFASDTTNSMVGQHNSVFSHLKESIPHITCVKCSCHMIHLVASKACSKLPSSIEDLLRHIGAHFSRSAKRVSRLRECQEFYGVEIHKILSPANTRWLSLKACVDRTLEQYTVLTEYFRLEMFEDGTSANVRIYEGLNDKLTKVYLEFLSYSLEFLTDFNKLFQSDKPLLHCLKPEIEKLIRSIASNYMQLNHVRNVKPLLIDHANPGHFMPLEKVYLGVLAQDSVIQILQEHPTLLPNVTNLRRQCLSFYIELIKQIKDRFDFSDPVFDTISILDPKEAQSFERKDLNAVLRRYPVLNTVVDVPALNKEWREHALLDYATLKLDQPSTDATSYWNTVFELRNVNQEMLFPNLKKVICLLLVLPFSNASVERIFSQLKLIKTDNRNRLNTDTISALMMTKQSIKDSIKYEPPKSLLTSRSWKIRQ